MHRKRNTVTLDAELRLVLDFLSRPSEFYAQQSLKDSFPALICIEPKLQSVYTLNSDDYTNQQHKLRTALDKISSSALRLRDLSKDDKPVGVSKISDKLKPITKGLEEIQRLKDLYIGSENLDKPQIGMYKKMFEGNQTLEAVISTQAKNVVERLKTLADIKVQLG